MLIIIGVSNSGIIITGLSIVDNSLKIKNYYSEHKCKLFVTFKGILLVITQNNYYHDIDSNGERLIV